jgi:undecaprenyl-diphosphatase
MEKLSWQWVAEHEAGVTRRLNRAGRFPVLLYLFRYISRLGNGIFWYVLMMVMLAVQGNRAWPVVLQMIFAGLSGTAIYAWLKKKTIRPRPHCQFGSIHCLLAPLDRFSFPSGHTLHATAFTLVAIAYYPLLAWLLIPFTLLVALSRMVLGLHYLTDVLAGFLLGSIVAEASFLLLDALSNYGLIG